MKKKFLVLLCLIACSFPALGEVPELVPGHPKRYVVQSGDTLWGISGMYLKSPWLWPRIWHANPHVRNPHRIYPGDVLQLVMVNGRPWLRHSRGRHWRHVRLSPEVREYKHDEAIPPIPMDAIWPFLSRPLVVGPQTLAAAPYVFASEDEHLVTAVGNKLYVRGRMDPAVQRYHVVRCGEVYRDPPVGRASSYAKFGIDRDLDQDFSQDCLEQSGQKGVLGYEAVHVADAVIDRVGDPSSVVIARSYREVLDGDRLVPEIKGDYPEFIPRGPDQRLFGSVVSIMDAVSQVGPQQIVVINRGGNAGLKPGHVLALYRSGVVARDTVKQGVTGYGPAEFVNLPSERIGHVMVFRTFPVLSYALVMDSIRTVYRYDSVTNP